MSEPDSDLRSLRDAVVTLAGVGVILALLRMSAAIIEPLLLSLMIVAICTPSLRFLRRRGWSTGASLALGLTVIVILLTASSLLLSGALQRFSESLPEYRDMLVAHTARLDAWLASKGIDPHNINIGIGNVLEPIVVGRTLGLSAVAVLLSLVFWGWMFGIVGMLVSVPLSMALRAFAEAHPATRWLAVLMSPAIGNPRRASG